MSPLGYSRQMRWKITIQDKRMKAKILVILFSLYVTSFYAFVEASYLEQNIVNICETKTFGTKVVAKGNPAYTSYKSLLRAIDLAEKQTANGLSLLAKNSLNNAFKYVNNVLKKEPEADLSLVCKRLAALQSDSQKSIANNRDLAKDAYNLSFFMQNYHAYIEGYYSRPQHKKQQEQVLSMINFEREKVKKLLAGNKAASIPGGIQLKMQLINFDGILTTEKIVTKLYGFLDELNNAAPQDLADRSKRTIHVIKGFNAIAGDHPELKEVMKFAKRQMEKAETEMSEIYTGVFHKENVNKIVFTKTKFEPGNEASVTINPLFKTGDAIWATMYLSAPIKEALTSQQNHIGETMTMNVVDANGNSLYGPFEKWEVENYDDNVAKVYQGTSGNQTFYQFLLLPSLASDGEDAVKNKNFTLVHLVRGASRQPQRKKTFTVNISTFGKRTRSKELTGSFQIDFSQGDAPTFYQKLDNTLVDKFIKENKVPNAFLKNTALESQLLANMRAQGHSETYSRAIIQSDWNVVKPTTGKVYKEIKCAFPYKTTDGKCGYRTYTFKSFKSGSGWTKPQKFGGTDAAQRVACNKIN